ncbi:MAG: hypothetical protein ACI8TQ_002588 [Planctomycetota bacterium]|jgi:hypothetical protein
MLHLLAALSLSVLPNLALPPENEDKPELPYSELALQFRKNHQIENVQPGNLTLQELLDGDRYRKFTLGLFDIRFLGEALTNKATAKKFVTCATATLDTQRAWVEWNARHHEKYEIILEDFDLLHKWVKSWSTSALSAIGKFPERDIMERLGAGDEVREAHARIEVFMCRAEYMGIRLHDVPDTQILFVPDRITMLQLMCFAGWNSERDQDYYWKEGIIKWTSFWNEETQIIAMDYPGFPIDVEAPGVGAEMNEFEQTGLGQHASEKTATSIFWRYYGNNDALFYEAAMGVNLAISVYKENNVRTGAPVFKNMGASTSAYSVFVPGGNPSGGTLGARGAIAVIIVPLWRETKGRDHYVKPLGKAQKKGKKLARKDKNPNQDSLAHFIIFGPSESQTSYVTAPFFGPFSENKELPEKDFLVDYEDFFRAYSAGFFDWIKKRAGGKDAEANAKLFATLNHRLATRDKSTSFAALMEDIYGLPLSAENGHTDSLEWRFLTYISKGGR